MSKGGRPLDPIWAHYIQQEINNTVIVACINCKKIVSGRPDRMKEHWKKCNVSSNWESPLIVGLEADHTEVHRSSQDNLIPPAKKSSEEQQPENEKSVGEETSLVRISAQNVIMPKSGRPVDPIWGHYIQREINHTVIVECIKCKRVVSARPERMKEHWKKCNSVGYCKSRRIVGLESDHTEVPCPSQDNLALPAKEESELENERYAAAEEMSLLRFSTQNVKMSKGGRPVHPIWQHYIQREINDNIIVECISCKRVVSARTDRMKEHWKKCHGGSNWESQLIVGFESDHTEVPCFLQDNSAPPAKKSKEETQPENERNVAKEMSLVRFSAQNVKTSKGGRPAHPIWQYYIQREINDNIIVECINCKKVVSARTDRMKEHWKKCNGGGNWESQLIGGSEVVQMETLCFSQNNLAPPTKDQREQQPSENVRNVADTTSLVRSRDQNSVSKGGRPVDPIWGHYTQREFNDCIIVECSNCKRSVSARPDRMKEHWKKCNGGSNCESNLIVGFVADYTEVPCSSEGNLASPAINSRDQKLPGNERNVAEENKPTAASQTQASIRNYVIKTTAKDKDNLDVAVANFFYSCSIPFSVAEHPTFQNMISLLRPGYKPPTKKQLSEDLFAKLHTKLKSEEE